MVAGSRRTPILAIVVLAVAVGGTVWLLDDRGTSPSRPSPAASAARRDDVAVTTVQPDPRALRHVALVGATPVESAAVRELLPLLGPDPGIDRIAFTDGAGGRGRHLRITQPTGDPQRAWLGEVFARDVAARLSDHGETVAYGFAGRSGRPSGQLPPTSRAALGAAVAKATAALRKQRAHADLTVYPIGAVAVSLQLDERAMLGGERADWLQTAGDGDADDVARYLDVLAPDGTRIFYHGASTCSGSCGGPPTDVPGTPLPPGISAPSALSIHVTLPSRTPAVAHPPDVHLDCVGSAPSDVAALCHAIVLDRYRLLQPLPARPTCGARAASPKVNVRGTIGAIPIARAYGTCEAAIGKRWVALLRRHGFLPAARRASG
jgi:hypothetical protein